VAGAGACLMAASPQRPAQPVAAITDRLGEQCAKQVLDLVAGQGNQPGGWWLAGALGQGRDDQEGVGEHRERGPAVPGAPAADLMLVQATKALAGLECLLDSPAASCDPDQHGQRGGTGRKAVVEGQLTGPLVAADHEPVLAGLAAGSRAVVVQAQKRLY